LTVARGYARWISTHFGPLLAYEVLTAFFLEASFLGVMLFGWRRVGPKLHFAATVIVAVGTLGSAFWILSANSWMQTPAGFTQTSEGLVATNFFDVIFNPSFPIRFVHMVIAAYLTTALVVGGASAFQLLRGRTNDENRISLRMAVLLLAIVAPLQLVAGHESGAVAHEYQPAKVAAMEGWWETRPDQGTILFGWPDEENEKNHFEIKIPNTGSLIFGTAVDEDLLGLDQFAREDRPPVWPVFWSFRVMVGLGLAMIGLGWWGAFVWQRGRLDQARWLHKAMVAFAPAGFIAILAGWIATEVGRQPYVIYGILRTADAVSPVTAGQVATSLTVFLIAYAIIFTAGAIYTLRLIALGPDPAEQPPPSDPQRPLGVPFGAAPPEPGAPGDTHRNGESAQ
jgi:cytochrome d ubiquinol oxidase subunit I